MTDRPAFTGTRTPEGATVKAPDGTDLPLRLDLRDHSPTGFEWGYRGSGPAQLALAICAYVAGDEVALEVYQAFKDSKICAQRGDSFTLYVDEVESEIADIRGGTR